MATTLTCQQCNLVTKVPKGVFQVNCGHCGNVLPVKQVGPLAKTQGVGGLDALLNVNQLQIKQSFEVRAYSVCM